MDTSTLIGWVIVISLLSAATTCVLHYYTSQDNVWWLILALLGSILLIFCYIPIMKQDNSGILYTITKIISISLIMLVASVVWAEPISTRQWVGLLLAIISVILLST